MLTFEEILEELHACKNPEQRNDIIRAMATQYYEEGYAAGSRDVTVNNTVVVKPMPGDNIVQMFESLMN